MTLTVKLSEQDQKRLEAIVQATHSASQSEAVRTLINEKYVALQANMTLVERRGGHPQHLLQGAKNLSDRDSRRSAIDAILADKATKRTK